MSKSAGKGETILVVDDDAKVRQSIGSVLGDEGFSVITAADGGEAVASVERDDPSLVLLDVWMPGMDGIEVLSRIRHLRDSLPVIVLSGHGNVEIAVKATRLGALDFIEKPFSIEGLLSAVDRALGRASQREKDAVERRLRGRVGLDDSPHVVQRTLHSSVVSSGLGLHSGVRTGLILHPAPPDSGIRFGRVGGEEYVEAHVDNVDSTGHATTLYRRGMAARTVEHLLAALHAYGISNLLVKVEGEVPILDGSALEFCRLIESAGIEEQDAELPAIVVSEPLRVEAGQGRSISISPYDGLRVRYDLTYPEPVGRQSYIFEFTGAQSFREQIAPARTFGFVEEVRRLERAGLGQGGQLSNFILIGSQGIVNTDLRFPEELARHKILDVFGDLYLLGLPLRGSIHARKTGHAQNVELVRRIAALVG